MFQVCEECGKKFGDLRSHLKKHKMTWQEYSEKYNKIPLSLANIPLEYTKLKRKEQIINSYEIEKQREKHEHFRRRGV